MMEILKERKTPLLGRTRYTLKLEYEGSTPSRAKIQEQLAVKLKVDKEKVVIKHLYTRYGSKEAHIVAHVYDSVDHVKQLEPKHLLKKHGLVEQPAPEAAKV